MMTDSSSLNVARSLWSLSAICLLLLFLQILINLQADYSTDSILGWNVALLFLNVLSLLASGKRMRWGSVDVFVLAILFLCIFSALKNGSDCSIVFVEEQIPFYLFYFSIRFFISSNVSWANRFFFLLICLCLCIESITGLSQIFGSRSSSHTNFLLTGHFFNPGPYGGFLAVIIAVALSYLIKNRADLYESLKSMSLGWLLKYRFSAVVAFSTVILGVVVLPASMSRAGWVALAGSCLVLCFRNFRMTRCMKRYPFLTLLLILIIIICGWGMFRMKEDSALGRAHIWRMEWKAMERTPIYGSGPGSVLGIYGNTQEQYFRENPSKCLSRTGQIAGSPEFAFNEYLKSGIETGPLGLTLIVIVCAIAVVKLLRQNSVFAYGFIALMIFSLFSYPLSLSPFGLLLCCFFAISEASENYRPKVFWGHSIMSTLVVVMTLVSVFLLLPHFRSRALSMEKYSKISSMLSFSLCEESVSNLENIYDNLSWNYKYLYDYGYELHKSKEYSKSNIVLKKGAALSADPMFHNIMGKNFEALGLLKKAEAEYKTAYFMVPGRIYPLLLLLEMYTKEGQIEKAKKVASYIAKIPVNENNYQMMQLKQRYENILKNFLLD